MHQWVILCNCVNIYMCVCIASSLLIYTTLYLYLYCVTHVHIYVCIVSICVCIGHNVYLHVLPCAFLWVPFTHLYLFGITTVLIFTLSIHVSTFLLVDGTVSPCFTHFWLVLFTEHQVHGIVSLISKCIWSLISLL